MNLLDRLAALELIVVTGKGGVGKSTLTAALGRVLARRGRHTLLLEIDPRESLFRLLDVPPSGGEFQRALLARALIRRPQLLVLDEPVQGVEHGLEVPRVVEVEPPRDDLGLRRDAVDVLPEPSDQRFGAAIVQQLQAVDHEVLVLAQGHRRTPLVPPIRLGSEVELRPDESDHHVRFNLIHLSFFLYHQRNYGI